MNSNYRAFALFSGGLDSLISVFYMKKLGFQIFPIFFKTPFFLPDRAKKVAEINNLDFQIYDLTDKFIEVLKNPKYGFGKYFNPCIDCHGLMFRELSTKMKEQKVDFLISGEVLGQRPMSQRKDSLNSVRKLSGVKDLIVRPLSQKLLPDTLPITEGWVKKEDMLDIQGRGRYRQIELAGELGIKHYENPGGGCLLTDKSSSKRVRDLAEFNLLENKYFKFIQFGRHFRISKNSKLIVSKTQKDTEIINGLIEDEIFIRTKDFPGPIGIIQSQKKLDKSELELICSVYLAFNNKANNKSEVIYGTKNQLSESLIVEKIPKAVIERYWIK